MAALKERLVRHGYAIQGDEPLKLTISPKPYGYTGKQLAQILLEQDLVCEFSDPDFVVMMVTPETKETGLSRLEQILLSIPKKDAITEKPPVFHRCARAMSIRDAVMAPRETVPVGKCVGRVLCAASLGCPPAVPIVVCGERIDRDAAACLDYYGIRECAVVSE